MNVINDVIYIVDTFIMNFKVNYVYIDTITYILVFKKKFNQSIVELIGIPFYSEIITF